MLRSVTAALIVALSALAASACTVGLPSAIDAAPFAARMASAPFPDGVYCGVDEGDTGGLLVKAGTEDGDGNCASFSWDSARRISTATDTEGEDPPVAFAPVDLGNGVFLMQLATPEAQTRGVPYQFLLMVGAARGGVLAMLPLPADGQAAEAASRHPGVTLSLYKSASPVRDPAASGSGDAPIPSTNDVFYISGGSPETIRRLVSDMAGRMARDMAAQDNAGEPPKIPVFVRDQPGRAAHAPTEAQQHDLAELMIALGNLP